MIGFALKTLTYHHTKLSTTNIAQSNISDLEKATTSVSAIAADQTTVPGQTQTTQIPITSTSGQETISLDENESLEITGAHIEELPTEPEEELEENTQPTTTNWNNWYKTNQKHKDAWEKSKILHHKKQIREE